MNIKTVLIGFSTALLLLVGCTSPISEIKTTAVENVHFKETSEPVKNIQEDEHSTAQQSSKFDSDKGFPLTLKQIMADPDWLGRQPEKPRWSVVGKQIVYSRKKESSPLKALLKSHVSEPENVSSISDEEMHLYVSDAQAMSADKTWLAWTFGDSLFVKYKTNEAVIVRQGSHYSNLLWTTTNSLLVQMGDKIVSIDPETGSESVVFSWSFSPDPNLVLPPADYLAEEQIKLIGYIEKTREDKFKKRSQQRMLAENSSAYGVEKVYFQSNKQLVSVRVSPLLNYAIVVTEGKKKYRNDSDIMPHYIQENGRIKAESVRQRVADATPDNDDVWLVDLNTMTKKHLSFSSLPGYNDDVLATEKSENAQVKGDIYQTNRLPRPITLLRNWYNSEPSIRWHVSGEHVALMLEAWDNKDRWITTVDFNDKKLVTQHRQSDEAWINYAYNDFGWLNTSATLYYLTEETGYSQLNVKALGQNAVALTRGEFTVDNMTPTLDGEFIYYTANKQHPGVYEVFKVNTRTGEHQQITYLEGMSSYLLSPDENHLLLTHSKLNQPPELYLKATQIANPKEVKAKRITHTVSDEFNAISWTIPAIVPIASSNTDADIYSRVYLPENVHNGEPRRAVVFTHGAGYLQNAHKGWSSYFREYMFHSLLVQQGYVVLDMDYRASKGYGRDWRTANYRNMGKAEIEDLKDGVDWLIENANVDRHRVGTYGGSYGGFLTLMSLFKAPDLFQAGAALRPVTDWAHYNTGYTANILNLPSIDPIAYQRSSPIYFAEGLQKPLLINAPMVDSNVFFADVVRLVQRLIELEKTHFFETAIYPVEPHGFVQPSSWLDEYTRIYALFEENL
ncbi:S9 family peptidase [Alteromonas sp. 5E99-2]|uniref:S9 family peptidase n=1 Tax=Alteromonas sp. 5E99-2 TaxID=2817683 RepID=UPI001A99C9D2|nr:prolyl oligopeptidase family serine peptidase [Alteromonas sp. 5E99-2]MBO1254854.1 S9 family peptidase [Alteromonas sp. 5E99-2]